MLFIWILEPYTFKLCFSKFTTQQYETGEVAENVI